MTYVRAEVQEVAGALAALTCESHPFRVLEADRQLREREPRAAAMTIPLLTGRP